MKYFRYNIFTISESKYWEDQNPFTRISDYSKLLTLFYLLYQCPRYYNYIYTYLLNNLDFWYGGFWWRDILILNIILRHNFFQSFASVGRVDLVKVSVYFWCTRAGLHPGRGLGQRQRHHQLQREYWGHRGHQGEAMCILHQHCPHPPLWPLHRPNFTSS